MKVDHKKDVKNIKEATKSMVKNNTTNNKICFILHYQKIVGVGQLYRSGQFLYHSL